MSQKLQTKWIADNAIIISKIASSAQTAILANKLIPARKGVLNFTTTAASSDDVTTEVTAAATTLTPRASLTAGLGVYTGSITNGAADSKIVLVRLAGTNEGVDDGTNNEVYGVLSEDTGDYTISYKKSNGTAYTFPSTTAIDFYFVEIQNLSILSPEALLLGSVTGVVDATQATTLAGHLNGGANKHDASEIDVEGSYTNFSGAEVEAALSSIDTALGNRATTSVVSEIDDNVNDLITLSGVAENATSLGTFTGATIPDTSTVKAALQSLETALETTDGLIDGHLDGGSNKHDASEIDVEGTGDYYAPGSVETAIDTLDAQIKVNTDAISGLTAEETRGASFTLSAGDITNKYVDLATVPKTANLVRMFVVGGLEQDYGVDFTVITDGSVIKRLTWDSAAPGGPSTGMVADLAASDKIRVYWQLDA